MMQYHNNLIGKHFKTLMQTMPFHVHDLVTPGQFALVKVVGALRAMLWYHEIDNMDEYLVHSNCFEGNQENHLLAYIQSDLEILIGNVLNAFGDVDPTKIIIQIKLHLLPHLVKDICHFGLAIQNSTEVFECFNAIFTCAPS
jgi:hypothetical protein